MLLAYLDEVGEPGAFVSLKHPKFNTSQGFGYAGFIIPEENARAFGAKFTYHKRNLFQTRYAKAENKGAWEVKGSEAFRPQTPEIAPQNIRVLRTLIRGLVNVGGQIFYYIDEKPVGTPKQVKLDIEKVEHAAMTEVLNRVCKAAEDENKNVLFLMDAIDETRRLKRVPNMYSHILGRASERPEMRRAIEPPMHVDSRLSALIQFADWISATLTRAMNYQFGNSDKSQWVSEALKDFAGDKLFTYQSKLHFLPERQIKDLHHSQIVYRERPYLQYGSIGTSFETRQKLELVFQKTRTSQK